MSSKAVSITVDRDRHVDGTFLYPPSPLPGVLFVHGWGGTQGHDLLRARAIAALGCICLTFDLRGHAEDEAQRHAITRADSLRDVVAAYDGMVASLSVDESEIAVIGSSYGGYLAALLTSMRPVRWLALRVPALYRDEGWETPKQQLDRSDLATYRRGFVRADENRVLRACTAFEGEVLVAESEHDHLIPHTVVASYIAAFRRARSLTHRIIDGSDHGLTDPTCKQAYSDLLVNWITEMVLGAKRGESAEAARQSPLEADAAAGVAPTEAYSTSEE